MKIKVFINTYKNEHLLKSNIESILKSDLMSYDYEINVVNNYTAHFDLQEYCDNNNINVYHNYLRPDFSTGHLSRSWNQCILNGFKSLKNPDCDILVLAQNDNLFKPNWCSYIVEMHNQYDFISMGGGDQYHSYKPNHIINVGIWDERFCNIGYQEYDYFIRSFVYNRDRSSINDPKHRRTHNTIDNNIIDDSDELIGGMRGDESHIRSLEYHNISRNILINKWGPQCIDWNINYLSTLTRSSLCNFVYYPYFECDVNMADKNYLI